MTFEDDIKNCLNSLRNGGIILYPTDTIWGLGCDPTNAAAVEKVYRIKSRESTKSLIILVNSENMIDRYVKEMPEIAGELANVSETPLTIIYPSARNLAEGVCNEDGSVGIRICKDEFCEELINRFRKPIVSTSANFSGLPSPQNFAEIDPSIINGVDYVVKYRQEDKLKNKASSIIKINSDGSIRIIRN